MKKCTLIILLVVAFGSAEDHQPTARIFAIKTTYTRGSFNSYHFNSIVMKSSADGFITVVLVL